MLPKRPIVSDFGGYGPTAISAGHNALGNRGIIWFEPIKDHLPPKLARACAWSQMW